MIKKTIFIATILMMTACNSVSNKKTNERANSPAIGGEKDKHGCLASAGETWSELRQSCLQIFNEGIRLNPIQEEGNQEVISAFALFNDDLSKVEIFLPSGFENHNVILPQSAKNIYEAQNYKYNAEKGELSIDNVIKYTKEEPVVLIVYYEPELDVTKLKEQINAYGANIVYEYENFNAFAIKLPKNTEVEASIKHFEALKGVLQVIKDQKNQLN